MTKRDFNDRIDSALSLYSGSVTSARRSAQHNKNVGGHPRSLHLCGLAVDIVLDQTQNIGHFINLCERLELKAIDEGDHIHVQIN